MEKKEKNIGLIITIVILAMLLLFGGVLFTLSSMGYLTFDNNTNNEEKNNDEEIDKDRTDDNENNNTDEDNSTVLTETEALDIAKDLTPKYFEYYHNLGAYCGGYNSDDYLSFGSYETGDFRDYYASNNFNSINELKEYFSSFMIESLYPSYLNNGTSYLEQDGKLYCGLSHKGCGDTYNENESSYIIQTISENSIISNVTLISNTCGEEKNTRKGTVEITKNSAGDWLISKYDVAIS